MGLLGSNGAGKSTTMNIICGVLNQTEGEVFINGINETKESKKLQIGDKITIRGKGKFIFESIDRTTRNDRIVVNIKRYC